VSGGNTDQKNQNFSPSPLAGIVSKINFGFWDEVLS
jgi:hypothetical protein